MEIASGYKTITPTQFANAVWALHEGMITTHGLRVYLACFALVAIREAAARSRKKRREKPRELCRYREQELARLTGLAPTDIRRALRQLQAAQLVTFCEGQFDITRGPLPGSEEWQEDFACQRSPHRPIPVPRSLLRFLAHERSIALIQVALAYVARGLSIARRTGEINAKGTVKASWIADSFGLSLRAVEYAQAKLR
ncbi:MAG: hypothetical protein L0Z50_23955 [Verrucomicrobiales bacterium]|nr:hypothetical protein [Verrucomicrobiales bacterium]